MMSSFYKARSIVCIVLVTLLLASCASQSGRSYSSSQTRKANTLKSGTIIALHEATIEDDPSGLGALGGAVVGGITGSTIGGGSGRLLTGVGGAVLGALLGTGIEKVVRTHKGIEITVRLADGQEIAIVQQVDAEEEGMQVGDKVRVLTADDGSVRVRPF